MEKDRQEPASKEAGGTKLPETKTEIEEIVFGLREMRSTKAMLATEMEKLEALREKQPEAPQAPQAPRTETDSGQSEAPQAPLAPANTEPEAFNKALTGAFAGALSEAINEPADNDSVSTEERLKTMAERLRSYVDESMAPRKDSTPAAMEAHSINDKEALNEALNEALITTGLSGLNAGLSNLSAELAGLKAEMLTRKDNQTVEINETLHSHIGGISSRLVEIESAVSKVQESSLHKTGEQLAAISEVLRSYVNELLAPRLETGIKALMDEALKDMPGVSAEIAGLKNQLQSMLEPLHKSLEALNEALNSALRDKGDEKLTGVLDKIFTRVEDIERVIWLTKDELIRGNETLLEKKLNEALGGALNEALTSVKETLTENLRSYFDQTLVPRLETVVKSLASEYFALCVELSGLRTDLTGLKAEISSMKDSHPISASSASDEVTPALQGRIEKISASLDEEVKSAILAEIVSLKEGIIEIMRFLLATSR